MLNIYSSNDVSDAENTTSEKSDIKNFEMPDFFGEQQAEHTGKAEQAIFEDFENHDNDPVKSEEYTVSEYKENDFTLSVNELISRMQQENKKQKSGTDEASDKNTNLDNIEQMLSNHEKNLSVQSESERIKDEAKQEAALLVVKARREAEEIIDQAKTEGFKEGYSKGLISGRQDGYDQGYTDSCAKTLKQTQQLLSDIKSDIEQLQQQRENIFNEQTSEMRDLSIAIAEKVINVSLKSSTEIIEKMIISAVENIKNEKWAKIYLSHIDFDASVKADATILNALQKIAETVKVDIVDNKPSGTCIIELPDTIIDASVDTQISQITAMLSKYSD